MRDTVTPISQQAGVCGGLPPQGDKPGKVDLGGGRDPRPGYRGAAGCCGDMDAAGTWMLQGRGTGREPPQRMSPAVVNQ